jgi:photosystem II stability/assembly factor-like uncharacterized protein
MSSLKGGGRSQALAVMSVVLAAGAGSISAQTNEWTSLGLEGGTITRLVVDPQNPATVYAANYGGGFFRTNDGGMNWQPSNSGLTTTNISALAAGTDPPGDTSGPSRLYALTTSGEVFRSTDGITWNDIGSLPVRANGGSLAAVPGAPDAVYAGACGNRIFKSKDGGATWTDLRLPSPPFGWIDSFCISVLAVAPGSPGTLYVSGAQGLQKSTDEGETWITLRQPVECLVLDPNHPDIVYAGDYRGVFKTTDGGTTWTNAGPATRVRSLAVDPKDSSTVYAAVGGQVFKSTDGATTWTRANSGLPASAVVAIAMDPKNSSILYAGIDDFERLNNGIASDLRDAAGGVFKSSDGGASWNAINTGLKASVIDSLAIDPENPSTIFAGTRDGTGALWKSTDRGASWKAVKVNTDGVVIDPQNPSTVYGWSYFFGLEQSTDGGTTWRAVPGLNAGSWIAMWNLAVDPQNTRNLYVSVGDESCWEGVCGYSGVFKSIDGGASWVRSGLEGFWMRDVTVDPQNPATIYAGGFVPRFAGGQGPDTSVVYKSTNGGRSWDVVSSALPFPPCVLVDPQAAGTVYAYGCNGDAGIRKSRDGGKSWDTLSLGPAGVVWALAIDQQHSGTLYAGTDAGVLRSTDGGATWAALNSGLTSLSVSALAVDAQNPGIVYAGTKGGGVFAIRFTSQD